MNKKLLISIIYMIIISITIIIGIIIYSYFNFIIRIYEPLPFKMSDLRQEETKLSEKEVEEDIEYLIKIIEDTHPIFLEEVPEEYYKSKQELICLTNKSKSMTVGNLEYYISKYLSSIKDGHTKVEWSNQKILNINFNYINGKLYLLDEESNITNKFITKIGNLKIDNIINKLLSTFPSENYWGEVANIENYIGDKLFLENIGINCNEKVLITYMEEKEEKNIRVDFKYRAIYNNIIYSKIIEESKEKIAYIRLGICQQGTQFDTVLDDVERYKEIGIENYIIDITGNTGGQQVVSEKLLEALGLKIGNYGTIIRFSQLSQERKGYLRKNGYSKYDGNNNSYNKDNINLYVLTDEFTFSAAQLLAVIVKDGNLGKIVGRPSGNNTLIYGDVEPIQLPNSRIIIYISTGKWLRPDKSKRNEMILFPDIYVPKNKSILDMAIKDIIYN